MSSIISFFQSIGDGIKAAISFLVDLVSDLVYTVKLITQMVAELPNLFGWLPAGLITILLTLFGIVVIYKILGRD